MPDQAPVFELESYDDQTLPCGKRLTSQPQLVGHTIKVVVHYPDGRLGYQAEMVIVTETLCWIVLDTSESFCSEEKPSIEVRQSRAGQHGYSSSEPKPEETLHDYLSADTLFRNGLVTASQRDAFLAIEAAADQKKKQEKAEALRKELATLEGGAA